MLELRAWGSSHSAEKPSKDSAKSSRWPIRMHHLCEPDQANRRRELRVLHCRCYAPSGLRVRDVRRHLENFLCEMIDTTKKAATAGNEDACAEIIEIGLFVQPAFKQLKSFTHAQVNDCVQHFPLDLSSGEP